MPSGHKSRSLYEKHGATWRLIIRFIRSEGGGGEKKKSTAHAANCAEATESFVQKDCFGVFDIWSAPRTTWEEFHIDAVDDNAQMISRFLSDRIKTKSSIVSFESDLSENNICNDVVGHHRGPIEIRERQMR